MQVYQYDLAGLFVGATVADESPLEAGVFLMPARCTLLEPPQGVPEGSWPRFNGQVWCLVNRPAPVPQAALDPVAKLTAFLAQNPDVAKLVEALNSSPPS
ncbi:hypothetical protein PS862_02869 [Pseudomonas fluorescens]|uniref:Phage tail protein n=1 Tax=Pseudomonas fluorescens TaxID=294 RepID=A0A5E7KI19_PSEFL|nr:phage tail protein [Pseudomonas fluorescens]VVP01450.1 hypothetical protein PS862_02869 [Pseudomonas fluorescens]